MNSISIHLTKETTSGLFKSVKRLSISQVSCTQTTQLLKEKSSDLSSSTSFAVPQLGTSFVGIKANMHKTGQSLQRKTRSSLMTLILLLLLLSSYVSLLMRRNLLMMQLGKLCIILLHTQTTQSFLRLLKNGQLVSFRNFCLDTSI